MTEKYVRKCPRCGGDIVEKEVTEVLYGGQNTALVRVTAGVCLLCGERLYTPDTVRQFEEITLKLKNRETAQFEPVGRSFRVALAE